MELAGVNANFKRLYRSVGSPIDDIKHFDKHRASQIIGRVHQPEFMVFICLIYVYNFRTREQYAWPESQSQITDR